jgi:hypothetical protein
MKTQNLAQPVKRAIPFLLPLLLSGCDAPDGSAEWIVVIVFILIILVILFLTGVLDAIFAAIYALFVEVIIPLLAWLWEVVLVPLGLWLWEQLLLPLYNILAEFVGGPFYNWLVRTGLIKLWNWTKIPRWIASAVGIGKKLWDWLFGGKTPPASTPRPVPCGGPAVTLSASATGQGSVSAFRLNPWGASAAAQQQAADDAAVADAGQLLTAQLQAQYDAVQCIGSCTKAPVGNYNLSIAPAVPGTPTTSWKAWMVYTATAAGTGTWSAVCQ